MVMTEIDNDKLLRDFFTENRQEIADRGFSRRVMHHLPDRSNRLASHIIADARTRAENDAAQITATAQRSIESQQQQALVSLKGEVGVLATALAGKILGSKLENDDVQSSMIDQMIADLDSDKK